MGKVFTWDEIATGSLPRPEGFEAVGALLRQELTASPVVAGALIHGSFLRGDFDRRSDIDVVMVYPYARQAEAVALRQRLRVAAQARFVPIRIISIDTEMAMCGDHTFFPMYYEHLCGAACTGGVVKADPLPCIAPKMMTYQEEAHGYLTRKANGFDRVLEGLPIASEEQLVVAIGKALSFPIHTARKMLQCLAPQLLTGGDGKAAVVTLYPQLGIPGAVNSFFELHGLDRMYTEALAEQQDRPDAARYALLLERLRSAIVLAQEFARINLVALRSPVVRPLATVSSLSH